MITVLEERPEECIGTLTYLFWCDGKEVIGEDFNLNIMLFVEAIKSGTMRFYVARNSKKEAVGYAIYSVYPALMRAQELTADCHAIYVLPEYRGRVSIKLIKTAEILLKKQGVQRIYIHTPYRRPELADMLCKDKMGYSKAEYMLEKLL